MQQKTPLLWIIGAVVVVLVIVLVAVFLQGQFLRTQVLLEESTLPVVEEELPASLSFEGEPDAAVRAPSAYKCV